MRDLNLSWNRLEGPFPSVIFALSGTLVNLRLDNNQFSGLIPEELELLKKLRYMDLSNNSFTGSNSSYLLSVILRTYRCNFVQA